MSKILSKQEEERIEREEQSYNIPNIRDYNRLLMMEVRLRQIDNWREQSIHEALERIPSENANQKID